MKKKSLVDLLKRGAKKNEVYNPTEKVNFHNLIILDESGSMDCIRKQVVNGCNEALQTIRIAQREHPHQRQYVSIFLFDNNLENSKYLFKDKPIDKVKDITEKDYCPKGMTPLYDAIGFTITDLKQQIAQNELNLAMVTVITDGYENASREYSGKEVKLLIELCKEKGWIFTFIGANIDVRQAAKELSISNNFQFEQTNEGTREMFKKERKCRENYYSKSANICLMSKEKRKSLFEKLNEKFFNLDEDKM